MRSKFNSISGYLDRCRGQLASCTTEIYNLYKLESIIISYAFIFTYYAMLQCPLVKIAYCAFWHCSNYVPIMLDFMLLHSQLC